MNSKFIGAVFLILGTCIGGSMLALPIATAQEGVVRTIIIMISAWVLMTTGAFALLKVNLKLPENSNLVSMSKATLGRFGAILTWGMSLALLYTLLSAYISSGEDLLSNIFDQIHLTVPMSLNAIIFTAVLGFVVFRGIRLVDFVNRGLMSSKLLVCLVLILLLLPFSHMKNLSFHHLKGSSSVMTCITAFGYASIIPSIRTYLHSNTRKLYWAILLGGLIPLTFYLAWILVVQATIPTADNLVALSTVTHPLKGMMAKLANHTTAINILTNFFTSICVLTSFLGVALSLSDFISDGIKVSKSKISGGLLVAGLTLLPPLVMVLVSPAIFLQALNYAGILCIGLLLVLPLLMALSLFIRKYKQPEITHPNSALQEKSF